MIPTLASSENSAIDFSTIDSYQQIPPLSFNAKLKSPVNNSLINLKLELPNDKPTNKRMNSCDRLIELTVNHLDGKEYVFRLPQSATISNLLDHILYDLNHHEKKYFNIYILNDKKSENTFDKGTSFTKIINCKRDKNITDYSHMINAVFNLGLEIYPLNPIYEFQTQRSRYLLAEKLMSDLVAGKLCASRHIHCLLCAYYLQMKLGPQTLSMVQTIYGIKFAPPLHELSTDCPLVTHSTELTASILKIHKSLKNKSHEKACELFLNNSMKLQTYNLHLFRIKNVLMDELNNGQLNGRSRSKKRLELLALSKKRIPARRTLSTINDMLRPCSSNKLQPLDRHVTSDLYSFKGRSKTLDPKESIETSRAEGHHLYKSMNKEIQVFKLGISSNGFIITEGYLRIATIPWDFVKLINHKRKSFNIISHTPVSMMNSQQRIVNYYCTCTNKSQASEIFNLAKRIHAFIKSNLSPQSLEHRNLMNLTFNKSSRNFTPSRPISETFSKDTLKTKSCLNDLSLDSKFKDVNTNDNTISLTEELSSYQIPSIPKTYEVTSNSNGENGRSDLEKKPIFHNSTDTISINAEMNSEFADDIISKKFNDQSALDQISIKSSIKSLSETTSCVTTLSLETNTECFTASKSNQISDTCEYFQNQTLKEKHRTLASEMLDKILKAYRSTSLSLNNKINRPRKKIKVRVEDISLPINGTFVHVNSYHNQRVSSINDDNSGKMNKVNQILNMVQMSSKDCSNAISEDMEEKGTIRITSNDADSWNGFRTNFGFDPVIDELKYSAKILTRGSFDIGWSNIITDQKCAESVYKFVFTTNHEHNYHSNSSKILISTEDTISTSVDHSNNSISWYINENLVKKSTFDTSLDYLYPIIYLKTSNMRVDFSYLNDVLKSKLTQVSFNPYEATVFIPQSLDCIEFSGHKQRSIVHVLSSIKENPKCFKENRSTNARLSNNFLHNDKRQVYYEFVVENADEMSRFIFGFSFKRDLESPVGLNDYSFGIYFNNSKNVCSFIYQSVLEPVKYVVKIQKHDRIGCFINGFDSMINFSLNGSLLLDPWVKIKSCDSLNLDTNQRFLVNNKSSRNLYPFVTFYHASLRLDTETPKFRPSLVWENLVKIRTSSFNVQKNFEIMPNIPRIPTVPTQTIIIRSQNLNNKTYKFEWGDENATKNFLGISECLVKTRQAILSYDFLNNQIVQYL